MTRNRAWSTLSFCLLLLTCVTSRGDDWPQWGGPQRDLVWRETGIVKKLPSGKQLPRVWSTPIAEGYSGPAVDNGRVFITDRVLAKQTERVHCLNAETGKIDWTHEYRCVYTVSYPAGPRATPVVDADRVYTLGAQGDLFCLGVKKGDVVWQKNFPKDFDVNLQTWGSAASPIVDGNQLIVLVGGPKSLVISFDKLTGNELWRALDDPQIGYAPPVIFTFGTKRQLIVWHPTALSSIDPQDGKLLWEIPFTSRAGLSIPTPRKLGNRIFITCFYNGSMMVEVAPDGLGAKKAWRISGENEIKTDALHSIMSTPWVTDTEIFGVCSYGQLRCLDTTNGKRLWETFDATGQGRWWNAFIIPHEDRFFLHNEQGDLIIANLDRAGYHEISRSQLIEPTRPVNRRMTIWSHPAFAMKSVFARNDREIIRVNLAEKSD